MSTVNPTHGKLITANTTVYPDDILSQGSDGVHVFRGVFRGFTSVAVKRILKSKDVKIQDEVRYLKENVHENIVKFYDYGSDDSFYYIAMEMCAGTLENLVSENYMGPSPGDSKTVLNQITAGLAHLHSKKIVHRDLKPQNILISLPLGSVPPKMKLADFGISKKQKREYYFSNTGSHGTVGWAAPELFNEANETFDLSIDIFSLGCIFGYVFTKHHPFGGTLERSANIVKDKLSWTNKKMLKETSWKVLIKKMISHDPNKRPTIDDVLKYFPNQTPKTSTTKDSIQKASDTNTTRPNAPLAAPSPALLRNQYTFQNRKSSNAIASNACKDALSNIERQQSFLLSPNSSSTFSYCSVSQNVPQRSQTHYNPSSALPVSSSTSRFSRLGSQYSSLRMHGSMVQSPPAQLKKENSARAVSNPLQRSSSMSVKNQSYASVTSAENRKPATPTSMKREIPTNTQLGVNDTSFDRRSSINTSFRESANSKPLLSPPTPTSGVQSLVQQFESNVQINGSHVPPKSSKK